MTEQQRWVVTLSGDRPLADLRADLAGAGFTVEHELTEVGVVTGRAAGEAAAKVRAIPGIADMSPDTPIDIGPPGSPKTW